MFQKVGYEFIPLSFYQGDDVVEIAQALIGTYLFHDTKAGLIGGKIIETEAYNGRNDRACHAFQKRTPRTEVMYQSGGRAYIYLCYGIHRLFNIVTNVDGQADAVLIRALEPMEGTDIMRANTGKSEKDKRLASGPGLVGKAMGFKLNQSGDELDGAIWLGRREENHPEIISTTRVGVDYAGEDAKLPWRFYENGNEYVSKK